MACEIKVMSSLATKEAYLELVPAFERASGHRVATMWVPTVDMMTRLNGGEIVDLVIMMAPAIEQLIEAGKSLPAAASTSRRPVSASRFAPAPRIPT